MQVANRIAAWQSGKKLPYKRRLAYLESTGTQWIDTGIGGRNTYYGIKTKIAPLKTTGVRYAGAYIGMGNGGSRSVNIYSSSNDVISVSNYANEIVDFEARFGVFHDIQADAVKRTFAVDGVEKSFTWSNQYSDNNFLLFGIGGRNSPSVCKIGDTAMYKGGLLVASFIPVMDYNDVPCMYDEVSGEFFYNQGTGTFLYGELEGGV